MTYWTLDDIPWQDFQPDEVTPKLISLAKAASVVEYNGSDYARYLCEVFHDDPDFCAAAREWAAEEMQHGQALAKWAELADPNFNFKKCFERFREGYQLPMEVNESVRGSRSGELIARCVVEVGTSSYYTAIAQATNEPVMRAIAQKIAADEFRHYKLFRTYLQRYLKQENLNTMQKVKIGLGRIMESEDDELAYAYFVTHHQHKAYDRKTNTNHYLACALPYYRKEHVSRMTKMTLKAMDLNPNAYLHKIFTAMGWNMLRFKMIKQSALHP